MRISDQNSVQRYYFDEWLYDSSQNLVQNISTKEEKRLEPKVGDLLSLLIRAKGNVLSREELIAALWPEVIVGEDTLARTVSRLRAVLGDSASNSNYIETIPKKGYRFKADLKTNPPHNGSIPTKLAPMLVFVALVAIVLGFIAFEGDAEIEEILARADSLYMQFDEQSNEAALALYEKVLELDQDNSSARAGIANAMVQRLVRWPSSKYSVEASGVSLTNALASGQLVTPESKLMLERARLIAEKAVRLNPTDVSAMKSLGFVYSAEGKIEQAISVYQKAITTDSSAWRSLINLGELYDLNNQTELALETFIDAFNAMQKKYPEEPQNIGPWQPALGNSIAGRYLQNEDFEQAQFWAEKILEIVPFNRQASTTLITALLASNQETEAQRICDNYASKLSPLEMCSSLESL
jgi:DNA-binding winged helix-turn-helix (wHTH) protein/Tfp pilus assembly protein PilF